MRLGGFNLSFRSSVLILSFGGVIAIAVAELFYLFITKQESENDESEGNKELKEERHPLELDTFPKLQNEKILSQETAMLLLKNLEKDEDVLHLEKVLVTISNSAAFTENQNMIRNCNGLPLIMKLLLHPSSRVQFKAAQACSNLAVNTENQKQIQACIPTLLSNNGTDVSDDVIQAHLQMLINLSVLNTWHSSILNHHLTALHSMLQSSKKSIQVPVIRLLVNLSCDSVSAFTLVNSEILPLVIDFLSTSCSPDLTVGAVTVVANVLEKWKSESLTLKGSFANYIKQLGIRDRLVLLENHENEDIRLQTKRALQHVQGQWTS